MIKAIYKNGQIGDRLRSILCILHTDSYVENVHISPRIRQELFHWNHTVLEILSLTTGNVIGAHVLVMDQKLGREELSENNSTYFAYQFPGRNSVYND